MPSACTTAQPQMDPTRSRAAAKANPVTVADSTCSESDSSRRRLDGGDGLTGLPTVAVNAAQPAPNSLRVSGVRLTPRSYRAQVIATEAAQMIPYLAQGPRGHWTT